MGVPFMWGSLRLAPIIQPKLCKVCVEIDIAIGFKQCSQHSCFKHCVLLVFVRNTNVVEDVLTCTYIHVHVVRIIIEVYKYM